MANENTNRLRELGHIARRVKADSSSEIVIKEATFNDEEEITEVTRPSDFVKPPELYAARSPHHSTIEVGSNAVVQILTILPPWGRVIGLIVLAAAGTYLAVRFAG